MSLLILCLQMICCYMPYRWSNHTSDTKWIQVPLCVHIQNTSRDLCRRLPWTVLWTFSRNYSVSIFVCRVFCWQYGLDFLKHLLVSDIAMKAVVSYSLESFWQDVLNHPTDKFVYRNCFMLNSSAFMVVIPVANFFSSVSFDASNRNWRRDNILCQVFFYTFASWRDFTLLDICHKSVRKLLPGFVNIGLYLRGKGADELLEISTNETAIFYVKYCTGCMKSDASYFQVWHLLNWVIMCRWGL